VSPGSQTQPSSSEFPLLTISKATPDGGRQVLLVSFIFRQDPQLDPAVLPEQHKPVSIMLILQLNILIFEQKKKLSQEL
jgi:hypothetical protein